jgi:hypothetical protein
MSKYPIAPDEINPDGLERLYRENRRNQDGSVGNTCTMRVPQRKVYLRMRDGGGYIEADLRDSLFRESHGQIPPELQVTCPLCGGDLHIDGTKKSIRVRYLDSPRRLVMPDNGQPVWQTVEVSVDEMCECSYPSSNGKGKCSWKAVIRDNNVSRVKL